MIFIVCSPVQEQLLFVFRGGRNGGRDCSSHDFISNCFKSSTSFPLLSLSFSLSFSLMNQHAVVSVNWPGTKSQATAKMSKVGFRFFFFFFVASSANTCEWCNNNFWTPVLFRIYIRGTSENFFATKKSEYYYVAVG